jgi:AcrR family transcriptional regulator
MPRPLSQEARKKAVSAAVDLLACVGLQGFSVDAVVRESGVAKTTLYRHFGSASDLLLEALDQHVYNVETPDHGNLRDDLLTLVDQYACVLHAEGRVQLGLDLLSKASRDPELRRVHETMTNKRTKPLRLVLKRAMDRGEIPTIDLDLAVSFVQGPFASRTFIHLRPITAEEHPQLVELILRGLGAAGSSTDDGPSTDRATTDGSSSTDDGA